MSEALQELSSLIRQRAVNRLALIVSESPINLQSPSDGSRVYVLELEAGNAAGGRGGGFGQRSVTRVHRYIYEKGVWRKTLDVGDEARLEGFEPPYYATVLPLTLEDGVEVVVAGVVDPALVSEYDDNFA